MNVVRLATNVDICNGNTVPLFDGGVNSLTNCDIEIVCCCPSLAIPSDVDEVSHLFRVMYALTVTVKTRHCSR